MEFFVTRVLGLLATIVDASTGAAIGVGVVAALVRTAKLGIRRGSSLDSAMSENRITLGRWLALGLELALAADILRTVMIPTWDEIGKLWKKGTYATVTDVKTDLQYTAYRFGGWYHADCEPKTAADAAIIKKMFGGSWSWQKRPVIVYINGRRIAASIAGMPHAGLDAYPAGVSVDNRSDNYGYGPNYDYIKGNGMDGHFDLHFPGSLRHKDWQVDSEHQAMIGISSNR
jgi:uncharacterized membrane protein